LEAGRPGAAQGLCGSAEEEVPHSQPIVFDRPPIVIVYAPIDNNLSYLRLSNKMGYSMGSAKSKAEWAERASNFLKTKLKEKEVTYVDLGRRLKRHGFIETEASITNKLRRGTFSAMFFLACLAALGLEGMALDEI
jgi:uncharacterized protein DUF6471